MGDPKKRVDWHLLSAIELYRKIEDKLLNVTTNYKNDHDELQKADEQRKKNNATELEKILLRLDPGAYTGTKVLPWKELEELSANLSRKALCHFVEMAAQMLKTKSNSRL